MSEFRVPTAEPTAPADQVGQPEQPSPPVLPPILPPIFPPLPPIPGQPQPPQPPPLRNSASVDLVRPFGLSQAFEAVVGMAEAWLRLAIDEMMYHPGEPVIPEVTKLLDRAALRGARRTSELASGYQHHIADMHKYTMYLNLRDADVHRRVAGMTTAAYETLRLVWANIDELNGILGTARFSAFTTWIEILLVDRVVATLAEVESKLRRLFDANKATADRIDPGIADATPPFVEKIDPGVAAHRPDDDSVQPA